MKGNFLFTSESVTEGHPDKVCDQISDAVLDGLIAQNPACRVACETLATTDLVVIAGEVTSSAQVDFEKIARRTLEEIGYTDAEYGIDAKTCKVQVCVGTQSPDIAVGVNGEGLYKEQGAGDQGLMFGYAIDETPERMPMPILTAHKLTRRLAEARKLKILPFLRPDGKSQVTVEYKNFRPERIAAVVISTQHAPEVSYKDLREAVVEEIIKKTLPAAMIDGETEYFVNPTGRFVVGGPHGDCGLTGRKIIVDTYGGWGRHGGGAFSGKDPSKVDRSASYMARYIAKNIIAAGLAGRCEIQIAYAIGYPEPVSFMVDTSGTGVVPDGEIARAAREIWSLKPASLVAALDLKKPIYRRTASYGHFGREEPGFSWEVTTEARHLRELIGTKKNEKNDPIGRQRQVPGPAREAQDGMGRAEHARPEADPGTV